MPPRARFLIQLDKRCAHGNQLIQEPARTGNEAQLRRLCNCGWEGCIRATQQLPYCLVADQATIRRTRKLLQPDLRCCCHSQVFRAVSMGKSPQNRRHGCCNGARFFWGAACAASCCSSHSLCDELFKWQNNCRLGSAICGPFVPQSVKNLVLPSCDQFVAQIVVDIVDNTLLNMIAVRCAFWALLLAATMSANVAQFVQQAALSICITIWTPIWAAIWAAMWATGVLQSIGNWATHHFIQTPTARTAFSFICTVDDSASLPLHWLFSQLQVFAPPSSINGPIWARGPDLALKCHVSEDNAPQQKAYHASSETRQAVSNHCRLHFPCPSSVPVLCLWQGCSAMPVPRKGVSQKVPSQNSFVRNCLPNGFLSPKCITPCLSCMGVVKKRLAMFEAYFQKIWSNVEALTENVEAVEGGTQSQQAASPSPPPVRSSVPVSRGSISIAKKKSECFPFPFCAPIKCTQALELGKGENKRFLAQSHQPCPHQVISAFAMRFQKGVQAPFVPSAHTPTRLQGTRLDEGAFSENANFCFTSQQHRFSANGVQPPCFTTNWVAACSLPICF